jgi:hypothetical protein
MILFGDKIYVYYKGGAVAAIYISKTLIGSVEYSVFSRDESTFRRYLRSNDSYARKIENFNKEPINVLFGESLKICPSFLVSKTPEGLKELARKYEFKIESDFREDSVSFII